MRSNAADFDVIAPPTLAAALDVLDAEPGIYKPLAGGTELMVAFGAGRLTARRLMSLHLLKELRLLDVTPDGVTIGAAATFTDLRRHPVIASDFNLLSQAASWTGSIANQNRATLGGNIVNASPAADSPPALLVYDADVTMVSASGTRTIPYSEFHLGYKKTALRPQELLLSIHLKRNFNGYISYIRKVGTRNAQAISKVAIAGLARLNGQVIEDIRLAGASLREVPTRLPDTERALLGQSVGDGQLAETIARSRASLTSGPFAPAPISDIRSTAGYRSAVAANLIDEYLRLLARS
jgi:CO/xanthine dehydrogenase FAD-binding subunit